jgi:phytoene/squalene synthetase
MRRQHDAAFKAKVAFEAAKRVFGIPDSRLYALADGIRHFLYNQSKGLKELLALSNPASVQRSLFDL